MVLIKCERNGVRTQVVWGEIYCSLLESKVNVYGTVVRL